MQDFKVLSQFYQEQKLNLIMISGRWAKWEVLRSLEVCAQEGSCPERVGYKSLNGTQLLSLHPSHHVILLCTFHHYHPLPSSEAKSKGPPNHGL